MSKIMNRIIKSKAFQNELARYRVEHPPIKGEVLSNYAVVTDRGNIVPLEVLKKEEVQIAKGEGKQELDSTEYEYLMDGLIPRPYPPESFLRLYESNSAFPATVEQIAVDVSGLGWEFSIIEGKREDKTELAKLTDFMNQPNPQDPSESMRNTLYKMMVDWGSVGFCAAQIVRNLKDEVVQFYHEESHDIWAHKDKKRYAKKKGTKLLWFVKFGAKNSNGEPLIIDPGTGKEQDLDIKASANELLMYVNYSPGHKPYGVPKILSAIREVMSLIGGSEYHLTFFTNYGVPVSLIKLTGEWAESTNRDIEKHLNTEHRSVSNAHKSLVMQVPTDGDIEFIPLTTSIDDTKFSIHRKLLREEVLLAYRMSPYRLGMAEVGSLGGNLARESTEVYKNSVIEPLQTDIEEIMNNLILPSMGAKNYEWELGELDTRDTDADAKRYALLIQHGVMTPNQARELLKLGPGDPAGDRYYFLRPSAIEEPVGTQKEWIPMSNISSKMQPLRDKKQ